MTRRTIQISAAASVDLTPASFFWGNPGAATVAWDFAALVDYGYEHVTLTNIDVPAYLSDSQVSALVDSILEPLVERKIGHIVAYHDRHGERPSHRETVTS